MLQACEVVVCLPLFAWKQTKPVGFFFKRVGLEYLFLVGGFAESPILQFEVRKEFERLMKIVIPQEVSLTILKGNKYYVM